MKRLLLFYFVIVICTTIRGQELKVTEAFQPVFEIIKSDDMMYDSNGVPCALVKVKLPIQDVLFEGNIVDVEYKVNEHWCYLTQGTKIFRIKCVGCQPFDVKITDVEPEGLSPKKCYAIKLEMPSQMFSVNSRVTIKMYESMMESREALIKNREYAKAIKSLTLLRDSLENIREKELSIAVQNKINFCLRQISLAKLNAIEFGKLSCGRVSIKTGEYYGFVDSVGNVIVKPIYEQVCDFLDGVAWVKEKGEWGIVSKEGAIKLTPTYSYICPIESMSGTKLMKVTSGDEKFEGVVDYTSGREILPCIYKDYRAGERIPVDYDYFFLYDIKKKRSVMFDKTTCQPRAYLNKGAEFYRYLKYGISMTFMKGDDENTFKYGMVDEQGKEIIPCGEYNITAIEDINNHREKDIYGITQYNGKYYVTRLYSIKQRQFVFDNIRCNSIETRAWGKWLCIYDNIRQKTKGINFVNNETGELAFPSSCLIDIYSRFRIDDNVLLFQEYDGFHKRNFHAFHYDGTVYTLPFNEVDYYFDNGLAPYKRNNKYGYVDTQGRIVIKPQYDAANSFHKAKSGLWVAYVSLNGESFYINNQGDKLQ